MPSDRPPLIASSKSPMVPEKQGLLLLFSYVLAALHLLIRLSLVPPKIFVQIFLGKIRGPRNVQRRPSFDDR